MPAGSSRGERLDPFALPATLRAADHAADGRLRLIELYRERVVLRRSVRGIKMAVNLPVAAYIGIVIRMEPPAPNRRRNRRCARAPRSAIVRHAFHAAAGSDIVTEWQAWGGALALPLLVEDADGRLRRSV